MNNPYPYSADNKRYLTYNHYLKERFGAKVYRIALDCGAGCPNRDGVRGSGGCVFCAEGAAARGKFCGMESAALRAQFERGRAEISKKCPDGPYIAYFQSGSNTYGELNEFAKVFEQALGFENVIGLSIATRADCVDERTADLLAGLSGRTYLTVELGLQTVHDETAAAMNRCHTYDEFLAAYKLLHERGVNVGTHIINGLPNETPEMMIETAREIAKLELHMLKIHLLYVQEGTRLAEMYRRGEFAVQQRGEYVQTVCSQLEVLPPKLIIARLTGDGERGRLIAPQWSLKKLCVMNEIDKEMVKRGSWQGKFYQK